MMFHLWFVIKHVQGPTHMRLVLHVSGLRTRTNLVTHLVTSLFSSVVYHEFIYQGPKWRYDVWWNSEDMHFRETFRKYVLQKMFLKSFSKHFQGDNWKGSETVGSQSYTCGKLHRILNTTNMVKLIKLYQWFWTFVVDLHIQIPVTDYLSYITHHQRGVCKYKYLWGIYLVCI